jgi:hypothetical protein
LCGERYLSGGDLRRLLHISPRTLQEYRDRNVIPYTSIGGKIFYPESELEKRLVQNLIPAGKD